MLLFEQSTSKDGLKTNTQTLATDYKDINLRSYLRKRKKTNPVKRKRFGPSFDLHTEEVNREGSF